MKGKCLVLSRLTAQWTEAQDSGLFAKAPATLREGYIAWRFLGGGLRSASSYGDAARFATICEDPSSEVSSCDCSSTDRAAFSLSSRMVLNFDVALAVAVVDEDELSLLPREANEKRLGDESFRMALLSSLVRTCSLSLLIILIKSRSSSYRLSFPSLRRYSETSSCMRSHRDIISIRSGIFEKLQYVMIANVSRRSKSLYNLCMLFAIKLHFSFTMMEFGCFMIFIPSLTRPSRMAYSARDRSKKRVTFLNSVCKSLKNATSPGLFPMPPGLWPGESGGAGLSSSELSFPSSGTRDGGNGNMDWQCGDNQVASVMRGTPRFFLYFVGPMEEAFQISHVGSCTLSTAES
eukprot:scaffold24542_cov166-Cylindrotheca_fusiformis.AAC.3